MTKGKVTGIQGNILEKHLDLSKALDTVSQVNSPQKIYYKQYHCRLSLKTCLCGI